MLGEEVPHLGGGPVAVVGQRLDHAARSRSARSPRRRLSRTSPRRRRRRTRARSRARCCPSASSSSRAFSIAFWSARLPAGSGPPSLRRDDDRARELREELAALRVGRALLVLDRRPLTVTRHTSPLRRVAGSARGRGCRPSARDGTRRRGSARRASSTGSPSCSASTSTPGRARSTRGARMKTPRSGSSSPASARSASKLATWRP